MFAHYWSYLRVVLMEYKGRLGGGCLVLICAGLVEHYTLRTIPWTIYVWLLTLSLIFALFVSGEKQHRKLQTRMKITGPYRQEWDERPDGPFGCGYYFAVVNLSKTESLENVLAECVDMVPHDMSINRVPMKVKNDDYKTREFTVNADSAREIDLVTGPNGRPGSQNLMILAHTVPSGMVLNSDRYRLTISISARNTPSIRAVFEVWVNDNNLQCILL